MKGLHAFEKFDWEAFSNGKTLMANGVSEWRDFDSGKLLGTKVEAVIIADDTDYHRADGKSISNRFEKITIKVAKVVRIPQDAIIRPVNVTATVYGDYRNQLSVKAEDIQIVPQRQGQH